MMKINRAVRSIHFHQKNCSTDDFHHPQCPYLALRGPSPHQARTTPGLGIRSGLSTAADLVN